METTHLVSADRGQGTAANTAWSYPLDGGEHACFSDADPRTLNGIGSARAARDSPNQY